MHPTIDLCSQQQQQQQPQSQHPVLDGYRVTQQQPGAIFVAGEQGGLLLFSGVRLAGPAAAARKDLGDGGLAGLGVRCDLPAQPVGSLA